MLSVPPAAAETVVLGPAICPAERAVYELRSEETDEVWKLGFIPAEATFSIASDLYLRLTTPQREYWFTFNVAQGYGGISVWPISDPHAAPGPRELIAGDDAEAKLEEVGGYLRFLPLDDNLAIANDPPNAGDDSPAYILLPEIGQGLWYSTSVFTTDPAADRDPMPRGVFKRTGCLVVPAKKALPVHAE
jgi:hypothetical protein